MNTILCVGNRFCSEDSVGPRVYDYLLSATIPSGVNVIDAGLAGIDLLHYFETSERVVVVDRIQGFGRRGELLVLRWNEIAQSNAVEYGHSGGLQYLLLSLPALGLVPRVEVILIGLDGPADGDVVASLARMALEAADGEKMVS